MDYIEEYLKCRTSNNIGTNSIRLDSYDVKGDKILIKYLIYQEPHFCPTTWTFETYYDKYKQWERQYLRKKKINKIRYDLQTPTFTRHPK
jgi:hypothetical protein